MLGFPIGTILAIFNLQVTPMVPIKFKVNKQIPWGIYVPRLIFIWGVKNGKVNQRTMGPVSITLVLKQETSDKK